MSLYRNKYRIASARLQSWNYGWNAAYFVTICTDRRIRHFGDVFDGQMQLSEIGVIADRCWRNIPVHFPFVKLGVHIIMPNHVHGIVVIDRGGLDDDGRDAKSCVSTAQPTWPPPPSSFKPPPSPHDGSPQNKFGPQSKNLASIIRGYKTGVTKHARIIQPEFKWQPRYHDHIIRDDKAFLRISKYIHDNPQNWNEDYFF